EIVVAWCVMNVQPVAPSATVAPRAMAAMRRGAMDAAEREFTDPPEVRRVSSTQSSGSIRRFRDAAQDGADRIGANLSAYSLWYPGDCRKDTFLCFLRLAKPSSIRTT